LRDFSDEYEAERDSLGNLCMARRLAFAIAAGLALGGCCHNGFEYSAPHSNSLTKLVPLPKTSHVKLTKARGISETVTASKDPSPKEDELSKLKPYSKEWHAALNAINQAADDELRKKLVICRGCELPASEDQVSSIWPKPTSGGYLSLDAASRFLSAESLSGMSLR